MKIGLLILDVDGVLTDGRLVYSEQGEQLKIFHVHDGLGIKAAQENDIQVAVISARDSAPLNRRLDDLGIVHRFLGCSDKLEAFESLLKTLDIKPDNVAYIGDDVIDLGVMRKVGFPIAVANANGMVKAIARHRTQLSGGEGAVREAIDFILRQQIGLEKAYRKFL
ncbi:MAG: HAD-IIIA family hydrolase [Natronospirillum sp.]|uniref:KdsC family phosphatase n=1 Tax=Natronospirillum sp. TaxID=2812955 RepID=UPI0025ECE882|nr:HAD-IIIA family hydrolase [Natronospirillum sp.]MCH8552727.1 HAD-IIIA family hydrolase [Natronospirillum sp.]